MKRIPSTLFAPDTAADLGHAALVPMSPEILALYRACQRNTPWGTGVDDVLSADRLTRGEPEQVAYAQRVDPHDAMPQGRRGRYRAYVQQRRYAVKAYSESGIPAKQQAQVLGVSVHVIQADKQALGLQNQAKRGLDGHTPEQVQALLDQGLSKSELADYLGLSRQSVSYFCMTHGLHAVHGATVRVQRRRAQVLALAAAGHSKPAIGMLLMENRGLIHRDMRALGLPRPRRAPTLKGHTPDVIKAMLDGGLSRYAVAQRLGVVPPAVYAFCRRAGLSIVDKPKSPANAPSLPTFRL